MALDRIERAVAAAPFAFQLGRVPLAFIEDRDPAAARRRGSLDLVLLKNIHWSARARASGSAGTYSVPSARYQRIAFDSARCSPLSSSSVGTRRAGSCAQDLGAVRAVDHVDLDPLVGDAESARICRTFQQFPELCEL